MDILSTSPPAAKHLDKKYCLLFKFFSIYALIIMVVIVITALSLIFTAKKPKTMTYYLEILLLLFTYFLIYFQNNLLYTMCTNSI